MSETMWAPWRMSYIKREKDDGCVFCAAVGASPSNDLENLILEVRADEFVIMNRFPYSHAHIMVCPRRHVSKLGDLTQKEQASFFALVTDAEASLRKAFAPQGINLGMNIGKAAGAGIESHIHMHLVPRWEGDTNFMPMIADCRIMPEHITETYNSLLPFFAERPGSEG